MKPETAQVTVFIPTFNRLRELQRAVASVRSQGDCVHLHVLDNASTDGTGDWLRKLAREIPGVELTLREKNEGALRSFAEGFERVRTPYLVPLADDDELASGFLESALRIAGEHPDLGAVVFTTESRCNGEIIERSPADPKPGRLDPAAHLTEWAAHGHYVSWSSILWRTEPFMGVRPAEQLEKFGFVSDVWMQFLVFAENPVFISHQIGSLFQIHPGQWSRQIDAESLLTFGQMVREIDRVLDEKVALPVEQRRKFLADVCLRFNAMVGHQCQQVEILPEDSSIRRWLDAYIELIYPHAGFAGFPLLSFFEEYRSLRKAFDLAGTALRERDDMLQKQAARLREVEHSWIWRLSKRFFFLEHILRKTMRRNQPGQLP